MTYRYHRVTQLLKKTGNIENNIVNRGRTSPSDKRELAKIVMAYRRQLFRNLGCQAGMDGTAVKNIGCGSKKFCYYLGNLPNNLFDS